MLFAALSLAPSTLAMLVMAPLAGFGAVGILEKGKDKLMAVRDRAADVSVIAHEEGFDIFAKFLRAVSTGDQEKILDQVKIINAMFMDPGALTTHLNKLFTKQLTKRLADDVHRLEIVKAMDDFNAKEKAKTDKILADAENAKTLAAVKDAATAAAAPLAPVK